MVEESGDGDGQPVGGYVFWGEEAAEEESAGEGDAEGVGCGSVDEAGELEESGDGGCEDGEGEWSEFWKQRGEEPVKGMAQRAEPPYLKKNGER